jgi:acylphosphatase
MSDLASVHALVTGRVQGVFFRAFVQRQAERLGLTGWVRNLPDGRTVELEAEGDRDKLNQLLEAAKTGPPNAHVEKVQTDWKSYPGKYADFRVR